MKGLAAIALPPLSSIPEGLKSWEQSTVEFAVDCLGYYNPEEELEALG